MEEDPLAIFNKHPRDERIRFQDEGHAYFIDGQTGEYTSVTTVIHDFFPVFDADEAILKMTKSRRWPNNPLFGKTPDEIKDIWARNGKDASDQGTRLHETIEDFFKFLARHGQVDFAPAYCVEYGYFLDFFRDHVQPRFVPYRTEMRIFHEEVKIAGSIDMIFQCIQDPTRYYIYDWKRSKEIKTSNGFGQKAYGPLSHLDDCNYETYSLQLNIYKRILQEKYDMNVVAMALVVFHPNQSTYQLVGVREMAAEVDDIWSIRKSNR